LLCAVVIIIIVVVVIPRFSAPLASVEVVEMAWDLDMMQLVESSSLNGAVTQSDKRPSAPRRLLRSQIV